jgi:hypothetical protein
MGTLHPSGTMQVNAEDLAHDSRLQFFAAYVLQGLVEKGLVHSKHRTLITSKERRLVEEMMTKGLADFENDEFEAAIKWVAAGAGLELDVPKLRDALGLNFK